MGDGPNIHSQLLHTIRSYDVPPTAQELLSAHQPLILTGPTASGKNTIASYIEGLGPYKRVVTHTTRPIRPGEVEGRHYYFVSEQTMLGLLMDERMIEAKLIHGETVYSTSIEAYKEVVNAGNKPILVIDVQGAEEIIKKVPSLQPVFVLPPDFETWMERLHLRGSMSHQERQRRFRSAQKELELAFKNDHYTLVINHDVP